MRILLFLAVAVLQLASIGWMLGARELVLHRGQVVRFVVEPVDPYDPFRGRYVVLGFPESVVENAGDFSHGDSAYAIIQVDSQGYATIEELRPERPEGEILFLKVRVVGQWYQAKTEGEGSMVTQIALPFDRYYMNEHIAPEAERKFREAMSLREDGNEQAAMENYLVVKILNGRAVAQQLVLGGEPL